MNKRETESHIVKHIDHFMVENGFKHKKSEKTQVEYYRKFDGNNFERFSLSTLNYYDEHKLRFGFGKRVNVVEELVSKVNEQVPLKNPSLSKDDTTFGFGYNSYNQINKDGCFEYMRTEEDVIKNVKLIIDFSEKEAFPFLEKLGDLREVDRLINGEEENWWETDWQKPFHLGYFYLRRMIIARLSGRKDFPQFIEKLKSYSEGKAAENGRTIDWNDHSNNTPLAMHLLESVDPLY